MADDPYKIDTPSAAKQFGIAVFFGAIAATLAYIICDQLAKPSEAIGSYQTQGAYKFVFYVTALAGGFVFIVTLKLYKLWADKKYRESLGPPPARVVDRAD